MKTLTCRGRQRLAAAVLCACVVASVAATAAEPARDTSREITRQQGFELLATALRQIKPTTDLQHAVKDCIGHLAAGQPELASRRCNAALQLEPANSHLHLLNALVYHTLALDGDVSKSDLAEQGYRLALQFDASNWQAHYFLGTLYFERRRWAAAQDEFAEALLFEADDADCLAALAAASYQARDPATAAAALDRLSDERKRQPGTARTAAVTYAAIGNRPQAERWLGEAGRGHTSPGQTRQLQDRVRHWLAVYDRSAAALASTAAPAMLLAQATMTAPAGAAPQPMSTLSPPAPLPADAGNGDRSMVLIDVVMLKMEDTISTRKGINLLSSLNIQFGSPAVAALSRLTTTVDDRSGVVTGNSTVTRAITIPALNYSLNIVNSNSNLNEVLARPTIAALNGVKSEFFSGTEINAAVVSNGNSAAAGGAAVQIQKEIGVKLSVTPQFLGERKVRLLVEAQRTFVKPPNQDINFTFRIETSKINVSSNVVLDFGETLVLGGLSEKETSRARDGVPVLQDIPGLQYLFSRQDTSEFQRSVIMLITPRDPYYTYRPDDVSAPLPGDVASTGGPTAGGGSGAGVGTGAGAGVASTDGSVRADVGARQLRARYGDWFAPYPSLESVFNHLGKTGLYREFRTGDVNLERWDRLQSTYERLRQSLEFLYF